MPREIIRRARSISNEVHPLVSVAIIALALWLVLSVWGFAGDGYTDYLLVIVSGFVLVAMAIPLALWLVWRKDQHSHGRQQPFDEWTEGEFDTWQGRIKGREAAVEMLLPLAAVAFGMTAFAIVLYFTTPGV